MRSFKLLAGALGAALLVAACGGGGDGDQSPKIKFTSMVSFGDSLSDVGSYRVGVVALNGGGRYSVNPAEPGTATNWTELVAAQLDQPAPCAAQTGLNSAAGLGGPVAVVNKTECLNYAQGGARVTNAVGPGSTSAPVNSPLGQLTVPVVTQIANHLAKAANGKFAGTEFVTVLAGGNDVLQLLDELSAAATAAGGAAGAAAGGQAFVMSLTSQLAADATVATAPADISGVFIAAKTAGKTDSEAVTAAFQAAAADGSAKALAALTAAGGGDLSGINSVVGLATTAATTAGVAAGNAAGAQYAADHGPELVGAMATAGAQLAAYVKTQIVGNGAKYVAVVNLPDVSITPSGNSNPSSQPLILAMVQQFNKQLQDGLAGTAGVIVVDAFANVQDQVKNKDDYKLSNVVGTACDLTKTALPTSLVCTANTLTAGDVSHYLFADGVHPSPYGYKLLAQLVSADMLKAGWL